MDLQRLIQEARQRAAGGGPTLPDNPDNPGNPPRSAAGEGGTVGKVGVVGCGGGTAAVEGHCPVCGRRQVISRYGGRGQVCDPRLCRHCCREHPGGGAFVALELADGTLTARRPADLHEPLDQWLGRQKGEPPASCGSADSRMSGCPAGGSGGVARA